MGLRALQQGEMSRAIRIGEDYLAFLYDPNLELTEEFGEEYMACSR